MAETTRTTDSNSGPADALRDAGQQLLGLLVQRAAQAATDRVTGLTDRLGTITENGGQGLRTALAGRDDRDEGDEESEGEPRKGLLARGLENVKEKIQGAFGGGGGGGKGKKLKVTNIVEHLDIALPLRTTYNLWTQLEDFPSFMKKVESVEQESDEKSNWKAQVFWSHRTWEATVVEQVPDSHIVWQSTGQKGHVDGAVTFTELGPNLTRVLLVMEYWPQGLFERTGNLWRAQGRRARLEFKHFRRHAMTDVILHQADVEGWRGEIRDGEVVKTHEEALEEEGERDGGAPRDEAEDTDRDEAEDTDREGGDEEPYDEADEYSDEDDEASDEEESYDEEPGDEASDEEESYDEEPGDEASERGGVLRRGARRRGVRRGGVLRRGARRRGVRRGGVLRRGVRRRGGARRRGGVPRRGRRVRGCRARRGARRSRRRPGPAHPRAGAIATAAVTRDGRNATSRGRTICPARRRWVEQPR